MDVSEIKLVIEAALLAAGRPLPFEKLVELFTRKGDAPDRPAIREALEALSADYAERGIELKEVGSGFRIQIRSSMVDWLQPLWEERAPRYTRALLETLALIAYRQPITRGEIEEVRGVAVSSNIVRTLMERGWVRVVGHRDVPGKPAMLGTTREFLDYFGLKKLEDLPALAEFNEDSPFSPQGDFLDSLADAGGEELADAGGSPQIAAVPDDGGEGADEPRSDEEAATVASAGMPPEHEVRSGVEHRQGPEAASLESARSSADPESPDEPDPELDDEALRAGESEAAAATTSLSDAERGPWAEQPASGYHDPTRDLRGHDEERPGNEPGRHVENASAENLGHDDDEARNVEHAGDERVRQEALDGPGEPQDAPDRDEPPARRSESGGL